MAKSQKNSFVSMAEQVQVLNNNNVSVLTSMNDIVSSQDSSVTVTQLNEQGVEVTYTLPTVGKLQSDINVINNNIKRLSGLNDNSVHIIEGNSTKKIYLSDLNREPNKIDSLNTVDNFTSTNNWFFESLMNPAISIEFDLTDKIGNDVDGVVSRRYIVNFEKDENNEYTDAGLQARNDFFDLFVNKTDINLKDFLDWLTNETNTGVINNTIPLYDEQYFEFEFQEVKEHGIFSVLKQETDTINNKLWYHIYPFNYTTIDGEQKVLEKGDEVVLNKQDSVTRWTILETSTSSSDFRIRVERIEGYDPIPTAANILKYYGGKNVNDTVQVTVGFDEHLVVFMKPTNSKNKIKGSVWSRGTGVYTNDLVLDTDKNVSMAQYYLDTVYDYGTLLKDMIQKNIPTQYALTPNASLLVESNFKVNQINKHLTDTNNSQELKNLHSQKNNIKTKLEQINNSIIQKNKELSIKKYNSVAQKNKSQNELSKLVQEQESQSKLLYSTTRQIKSMVDTVNKSLAKFRVRGFWDVPEAVQEKGYKPQEVVQFIIQYRYSSKTGTENQTEGYTLVDGDNTKTGYFSNWVQTNSDLRNRSYDESTGEWTWLTEDVSDADTPNINQLDISIQPDEKVEIRIKSISEVGYPDSQILSDWSNTLTVTFPDDLNNILDENEFILQEAEQDNTKIEFEQTLEAKGINEHVSQSYYNNEDYVAHKDDSIETIYKDDQGNPFNLQEYLQYLTNKINDLESVIHSAKGVFKITMFNGSDEIQINNNSIINIDVNCQNYANSTNNVTYDNKLYIIKDYYLKLENLTESSVLNFLVKDSYITGTTVRNDVDNLASLVDKDNDFVIQENNQYIYFCDNSNGTETYSGSTTHTATSNLLAPELVKIDTIAGLAGTYLNKNRTGNPSDLAYSALGRSGEWDSITGFGTLICPQVNDISDIIVDTSSTYKSITNKEIITLPINIYWKFDGGTSDININELTFKEHTKTLRVRCHPSSTANVFDFNIVFNIQNKNIYRKDRRLQRDYLQ
jgi:hypothetical protein